MGDQIGGALGGALQFVPASELARVRSLAGDPKATAALFADLCRLNILYMIARAGSGHIGSSFSSIDMLSWLMLHEVRSRDVVFSSKGHDAPAFYALLIALGRLPFDRIHALRRLGGLPGHPDVATPGVETNTGSLGMGISKAKGMAFAGRRQGQAARYYVLTGDGELQEGQIWESLISAANDRLGEITAIVDHNKLQSDTLVARTSDLGDIAAKFAAFGWHVERVNGHDIPAFAEALRRCAKVADRPQVIIADTVKGSGVSFMEHTAIDSDVELYRFHSGAPDSATYQRAVTELLARINRRLRERDEPGLACESAAAATRPAPAEAPQRLIAAYSRALIEEARAHSAIVALNADLLLDTGLIPFKQEFPERFVECGIAEMDMVSQAGGMALKGLLPVVHSFACFLTARANEQIYNNATERTRIVYVGSLAGLVPGGPGHSHQAVRDIVALGGVPGLTLVEPSCEAEVAPLLHWCLHDNPGSAYLRLVSVPWVVPFAPDTTAPRPGRGRVLREGGDATLIAYGPVMLAEAWRAAELLAAQGIALRLVALPWLNRVDRAWFAELLGTGRMLFTLDNHYVAGGQGQMLAAMAAEIGLGLPVHQLGVETIPAFGSHDEVLRAHRLDAAGLADTVREKLDHVPILRNRNMV